MNPLDFEEENSDSSSLIASDAVKPAEDLVFTIIGNGNIQVIFQMSVFYTTGFLPHSLVMLPSRSLMPNHTCNIARRSFCFFCYLNNQRLNPLYQ